MADESQDSGEKTEEPTEQRIEESRKKGEVASSKELNSVIILSATVFTLILSIVYIYETLSIFAEWLYMLDLKTAFKSEQFSKIVSKTIITGFKCTGPIFLVTFCISILSNMAQIGFLFSPEVLAFKPERIDPISGFKKLFAIKSVVEAIKGIFKFSIILSIVYFFMQDRLKTFNGFLHTDVMGAFVHGRWLIAELVFYILIGMLILAIVDFAYQKISYKKKLMMTKQEAKKQSKEQDGNPEVKQKIKTIQKEMSQNRMMDDIPDADVVVTNPTHISVVLKYDKQTMVSPTIVAKGADHLAMRIREVAKENNVPMVENVPLARGLYKTVQIGEGVPRNLYKAVAEVLAFVYRLRRKRKAVTKTGELRS